MELNSAQIAQFDDQRYLLLRGAPADADLDPVIAEYEQHIDRRAQALLAEGKLYGLYADEPCTAGFSGSSISSPTIRRLIKECCLKIQISINYFRSWFSPIVYSGFNHLDRVHRMNSRASSSSSGRSEFSEYSSTASL